MGRDDRGSVTAELALALPAVVLVLALVLSVGSAAVAQQRCADAARVAARLASVGEPQDVVLGAARRVAGPGVSVSVRSVEGPWIEVEVLRPAVTAWFLDGALTVSGRAVAWDERAAAP